MLNKQLQQQEGKLIPCKAKIEHFPSRNELIQLLDDLIANNKYRKDYICDNRDNSIIITFRDSNIAFEFIKIINIQKAQNQLYAKIKSALIFNDNNKANRANNAKNGNDENKSVVNTEPNMASRFKSKLRKNGYTLNNRSPLLIADPYIEPRTLIFAEYAKNKSKWINPNGFKRYVNTEKSELLGEIGTYVTRSQADYTYKNYKIREVNKKKWISNKNFEIKHLPKFI